MHRVLKTYQACVLAGGLILFWGGEILIYSYFTKHGQDSGRKLLEKLISVEIFGPLIHSIRTIREFKAKANNTIHTT